MKKLTLAAPLCILAAATAAQINQEWYWTKSERDTVISQKQYTAEHYCIRMSDGSGCTVDPAPLWPLYFTCQLEFDDPNARFRCYDSITSIYLAPKANFD